MQAHHDHTRRREEVCWVEIPQVLRVFVRPTQRRDGPQAAREPGVEHVRVLLETRTRRLFGGHYLTVRAVPNRYALPPPELPGDVPVADVLQPPDGLPPPGVGIDRALTVFQSVDGWVGERPHRAP